MTVFSIPAPTAAILDRTAPVLLTMFPAAGAGALRHGNGWLNGHWPEGEFSIATTEPLLEPAGPPDREGRHGLLLEPADEILGRKLRLRMYGSGEFVARDLYDLCAAGEKDPAALCRALSVLTPGMRRELAGEVALLGQRAATSGRQLTEVHRPEWLSGLSRRAADLIRSENRPSRDVKPPQVSVPGENSPNAPK